MKVDGLLISAGYSSRMGEFKPLLDYKGKSFISNIISKLNNVCNKIVVVTGYKNDEVETEIKNYLKTNIDVLNKLILIHNSNYKNGMFFSLQIGLKKMTDCDWVMYHFVDQPHLPEEFYLQFITQIDNSINWIQPIYDDKKGHPILFNKSLIPIIVNTENNSLRKVSQLKFVKKKYWNCTFPQILDDIDTHKDLFKLK